MGRCRIGPSFGYPLGPEAGGLSVDPDRSVAPYPSPSPRDRVALPRPASGRFVQFVPLGQGGMGVVYKAFDTLLERHVAFKVARPDGGGGGSFVTPPSPFALTPEAGAEPAARIEDARARFVNEARLTSGVEHPSIAPIYDVGETDAGLPYYTMRLIPGHRTLADGLAEAAHASGDARAAMLEAFVKVCDAVAYAHARGIVHRDLKPSNVALGDFGEVVVLDWGLAKRAGAPDGEVGDARRAEGLEPAAGPHRRDTGVETVAPFLGTPGWIPPEALARGPAAADARGDVFALGVVLFELLTGHLPWPADDVVAYAGAIARGAAPDAAAVAPAVPHELASLCARALEREPTARLPSAAALAAGVRAWQLRAALDRERDVRLAEVRAALGLATDRTATPSIAQLDRAALALEGLKVLRPDDPERDVLAVRLQACRRAAVDALAQRVRRRGRLRAVAVGAALLVAASIAGAVVLEGRRRDAEEARLVAKKARVRAEADMRFMLFDLRERLEPIGRLDLLAAVADRALAHYRESGVAASSPEERLGRAVALRTVGEVYEARGDLPHALESYDAAVAASDGEGGDAAGELALEASLDRARRAGVLDTMGRRGEALLLFRRHVEEVEALRAGSAGPRLDAIDAVRARARVQLARALVRQNDLVGAAHEVARAARVAEEMSARTPLDATAADLALEVEVESAQIAAWSGDWAPALAAATRAYRRAGALESEDPSDLRWSRRKADAIVRMLVPLAKAGDLTEARRRHREGEAILARETAADPTDERWAERTTLLAIRMADALIHAGEHAEALKHLDAGYTTAARLAERDPSNGRRIHILVDLTDRRSAAYGRLGERERALAERRLNVELAERLAARDPANSVWRMIRAFDRQRLAEALEGVRDYAGARDAYEASWGLLGPLATEFPSDASVRLSAGLTLLGASRNHVRLGDRAAGLERMRRAIAALAASAVAVPDSELPYRTAQAREELAVTLDPAVEAERVEAIESLESAIDWTRAVLARKSDDFALAMRARLERRLDGLRRG